MKVIFSGKLLPPRSPSHWDLKSQTFFSLVIWEPDQEGGFLFQMGWNNINYCGSFSTQSRCPDIHLWKEIMLMWTLLVAQIISISVLFLCSLSFTVKCYSAIPTWPLLVGNTIISGNVYEGFRFTKTELSSTGECTLISFAFCSKQLWTLQAHILNLKPYLIINSKAVY